LKSWPIKRHGYVIHFLDAWFLQWHKCSPTLTSICKGSQWWVDMGGASSQYSHLQHELLPCRLNLSKQDTFVKPII
jgi:hypothetical protein